MNKALQIAYEEYENLKIDGKDKNTGEVRKISRPIRSFLKSESFETKLETCEELLKEDQWFTWIIAFEIAFKERKSYTLQTFEVFERWLKLYVKDWDDCDDFCVHPLGALLMDYPELFERSKKWCDHERFVVRRAAAVSLIYTTRKTAIDREKIFYIANKLMSDEHYLVQKAYGWLLKEYSNKKPNEVEEYVHRNKDKMTRLAFRYAIEKLDKDVRKELMKI